MHLGIPSSNLVFELLSCKSGVKWLCNDSVGLKEQSKTNFPRNRSCNRISNICGISLSHRQGWICVVRTLSSRAVDRCPWDWQPFCYWESPEFWMYWFPPFYEMKIEKSPLFVHRSHRRLLSCPIQHNQWRILIQHQSSSWQASSQVWKERTAHTVEKTTSRCMTEQEDKNGHFIRSIYSPWILATHFQYELWSRTKALDGSEWNRADRWRECPSKRSLHAIKFCISRCRVFEEIEKNFLFYWTSSTREFFVFFPNLIKFCSGYHSDGTSSSQQCMYLKNREEIVDPLEMKTVEGQTIEMDPLGEGLHGMIDQGMQQSKFRDLVRNSIWNSEFLEWIRGLDCSIQSTLQSNALLWNRKHTSESTK